MLLRFFINMFFNILLLKPNRLYRFTLTPPIYLSIQTRHLISETPILGTKMGMRRETLKALEQVRDHVVTERKQSKMQTLGASNPHNNNRDKHRNAPKVTQVTVL
jgi:hypothetical protein